MCGANDISFAIDGVVATDEDKYIIRLPRGLYGNNTIPHESCLDVNSDTNEWSHSWAMSKKRKMT